VPAATTAGTASTAVAASPQRQRSTFLDLGEPLVPGLARHPRRRQCGHGAALAPSGLEGLLGLAVETRSKGGSAPYCPGATGPDPTHGRRQSIVGTAKDPSRIGEARVQSVRQNRRQVHATTHASKAITGLAVIPEATRSDHLGVRFLLRPNDPLSDILRILRDPSRQPASSPRACDAVSDRRVDGTTDCRMLRWDYESPRFLVHDCAACYGTSFDRGCVILVLPRLARRSGRLGPTRSPSAG
jgi:hypothetical protein